MRLTMMRLAAVAAIVLCASTAQAASKAPIFSAGCPVSHRASDDPIVYPGQPGAAHSHEFSGNWSTDAHSTYESLRSAAQLGPGTTCNQKSDTAAYWVPTLLDAIGKLVRIESITAYFVPGKKDPKTVQAPPADLKVIADMATSAAHGSGWHCGDATPASSGGTLNTKTIRNCAGLDDGPGGIFPDVTHLQAKIVFPDCWDGKNLDSPDHRSHMAYAGSGGICPASHPVPITRLNMKVRYDSFGGSGFRLSSGAPATMHADFWNTWDQVELERRVQVCIRHVVDSSTRPCTEPGNPVTAANPNYPNPTPALSGATPEPGPEPEPEPAPTPDPSDCGAIVAESGAWCDSNARSFDGGTKVDLADLSGPLGDFTLEALMAPTVFDTTRWAFGATQGSEKIALMTQRASIRGLVSLDGVVLQLKWPTTTVSVKRHVALTREGPTYRLYIDGALVQTANGPSGTIDPDRWALGGNPGGYAYFKGQVEDAAFYPRALPPDRVSANAAPVEEAAAEPVEEAAEPVEEAATPVEEAATPVEEAATPVEEAATPVEEAATPVEEAATPVEEAATPVVQPPPPPEPVEEASEPVVQPPPPAEPVEEASELVVQPPRPPEPVDEAPEPVVQPPRPAEPVEALGVEDAAEAAPAVETPAPADPAAG